MSRKKPQKKSEADDIRELRKLAAKAEAEGEDKVAVREEKTPSTPQPAEAHQEVPETDFAKQAQVRAVEEAQINFNAEQAKLVADSAAELHKRIIARTNAVRGFLRYVSCYVGRTLHVPGALPMSGFFLLEHTCDSSGSPSPLT